MGIMENLKYTHDCDGFPVGEEGVKARRRGRIFLVTGLALLVLVAYFGGE